MMQLKKKKCFGGSVLSACMVKFFYFFSIVYYCNVCFLFLVD